MSAKQNLVVIALGLAIGVSGAANAAWQPVKPIEFIATAGPGGGTDNFARAVQSIITKHKLIEQPIAAMVQDECLLWVKQDAPYQNVTDFLKAVAAKAPGDFKMGGAQSKDTDETLTRMIDKAAKVKFTYIPFKSGAEAAVQLAGGHIDSHVNNPSESLRQWRGGTQRPLCAFSPKRLPAGPKITATEGWSDIPTCVEQGLDIRQFQQPRTVWLPLKVTPDQVAYYVDLMKKVEQTPEWKDY